MDGKKYLRNEIVKALAGMGLGTADVGEVLLEKPRTAEHGDLATNVAMLLASKLRKNPRDIATNLLQKLQLDSSIIATAEVAGAGFINFRFSENYYRDALQAISKAGKAFGRSNWGGTCRVLKDHW